jgi:hypothetical protein
MVSKTNAGSSLRKESSADRVGSPCSCSHPRRKRTSQFLPEDLRGKLYRSASLDRSAEVPFSTLNQYSFTPMVRNRARTISSDNVSNRKYQIIIHRRWRLTVSRLVIWMCYSEQVVQEAAVPLRADHREDRDGTYNPGLSSRRISRFFRTSFTARSFHRVIMSS